MPPAFGVTFAFPGAPQVVPPSVEPKTVRWSRTSLLPWHGEQAVVITTFVADGANTERSPGSEPAVPPSGGGGKSRVFTTSQALPPAGIRQ